MMKSPAKMPVDKVNGSYSPASQKWTTGEVTAYNRLKDRIRERQEYAAHMERTYHYDRWWDAVTDDN